MKKKWMALAMAGIVLSLFVGPSGLWADDDDDEGHESGHHERHEGPWSWRGLRKESVSYRQLAPVAENAKYKTECSSCHMVYHPGLLPARSWEKLMNGLESHFGENASLDEKTAAEIKAYLVANSADKGAASRRSAKINASISASETPIRITETDYFQRKHHEIRSEVWSRKKVGGKYNCLACHQQAEKGYFDEDSVRIPK